MARRCGWATLACVRVGRCLLVSGRWQEGRDFDGMGVWTMPACPGVWMWFCADRLAEPAGGTRLSRGLDWLSLGRVISFLFCLLRRVCPQRRFLFLRLRPSRKLGVSPVSQPCRFHMEQRAEWVSPPWVVRGFVGWVTPWGVGRLR